MTFKEFIVGEIITDDSTSDDGKLPVLNYLKASIAEKAVIDNFFIDLCGWKMSTLITNFEKSKKE